MVSILSISLDSHMFHMTDQTGREFQLSHLSPLPQIQRSHEQYRSQQDLVTHVVKQVGLLHAGSVELIPLYVLLQRKLNVRLRLYASGLMTCIVQRRIVSTSRASRGPFHGHIVMYILLAFCGCQHVEAELKQLHALGTYELTDLPPDRKPIGCRWVFLIKRDAQGHIVKYKARLVAQGFSQVILQHYNETFALVVKTATLQIILLVAAHFDWEIVQFDCKLAYLHGNPLKELIYMKQPPGFILQGKEHYVLRLIKPLYGLKQAGQRWNEKLNHGLLNLGFLALIDDHAHVRDNAHL